MRGQVLILVAIAVGCRLGFDPGSPRGADGGVESGDGGLPADAAAPPCEPTACEAAGGTCVGTVCTIARTSENRATCPAGMPCRIECTGNGRPCRDGADCNGASSCEVRCIGYRACQDGVACGDSACTVTCDGEEACELGITVGPMGSCTAHCCGVEACVDGVGTCARDDVCM